MPKFVVQCQLSYTRSLHIGVEADNEEQVREMLASETSVAELVKDGRPVLLDEYSEDDSPLFPLSTEIVESIGDGGNWPAPRETVTRAERADIALQACRQLVAAYEVGDLSDGSSIDWSDVDDAHRLAVEALEPGEHQAIRKQVAEELGVDLDEEDGETGPTEG